MEKNIASINLSQKNLFSLLVVGASAMGVRVAVVQLVAVLLNKFVQNLNNFVRKSPPRSVLQPKDEKEVRAVDGCGGETRKRPGLG